LYTGYEPSKYDERDYSYASYMQEGTELPNKFCLPRTPFFDQGLRGTCVAVSAMNMKNIQEASDTGDKVSPEFIYRESKKIDGLPEGREGTTPRAALTVLKNIGTTKYESYPYGCTDEITEKLLDEAKKYRIESYQKITTVEELKHALYIEKKPVFMGLHVSKKFRRGTIESNGNHIGWHPYEMNIGGHMILVTGYDDNMEHEYIDPDSYPDPRIKCKGFIQIKNSWADWGDQDGYAWIPYVWVERSLDIYTTADIITDGRRPIFMDVEKGRWSEEAIKWCVENEIMHGYPDGTFKPGEPLTREQYAQAEYNKHKRGLK
jgi:hypothetical protein